jgi:hypothetical protein
MLERRLKVVERRLRGGCAHIDWQGVWLVVVAVSAYKE